MGSEPLARACELAFEVAIRDANAVPPIEAPVPMRSFLYLPQLPRRAMSVAQRVIDDDPVFRARVAAHATPDTVGEEGYRWLTRPASTPVAPSVPGAAVPPPPPPPNPRGITTPTSPVASHAAVPPRPGSAAAPAVPGATASSDTHSTIEEELASLRGLVSKLADERPDPTPTAVPPMTTSRRSPMAAPGRAPSPAAPARSTDTAAAVAAAKAQHEISQLRATLAEAQAHAQTAHAAERALATKLQAVEAANAALQATIEQERATSSELDAQLRVAEQARVDLEAELAEMSGQWQQARVELQHALTTQARLEQELQQTQRELQIHHQELSGTQAALERARAEHQVLAQQLDENDAALRDILRDAAQELQQLTAEREQLRDRLAQLQELTAASQEQLNAVNDAVAATHRGSGDAVAQIDTMGEGLDRAEQHLARIHDVLATPATTDTHDDANGGAVIDGSAVIDSGAVPDGTDAALGSSADTADRVIEIDDVPWGDLSDADALAPQDRGDHLDAASTAEFDPFDTGASSVDEENISPLSYGDTFAGSDASSLPMDSAAADAATPPIDGVDPLVGGADPFEGTADDAETTGFHVAGAPTPGSNDPADDATMTPQPGFVSHLADAVEAQEASDDEIAPVADDDADRAVEGSQDLANVLASYGLGAHGAEAAPFDLEHDDAMADRVPFSDIGDGDADSVTDADSVDATLPWLDHLSESAAKAEMAAREPFDRDAFDASGDALDADAYAAALSDDGADLSPYDDAAFHRALDVVATNDVIIAVDGDPAASAGWRDATVYDRRGYLMEKLAEVTAQYGAAFQVVFDPTVGGVDELPYSEYVRGSLARPDSGTGRVLTEIASHCAATFPVAVVSDQPNLVRDLDAKGIPTMPVLPLLDVIASLPDPGGY